LTLRYDQAIGTQDWVQTYDNGFGGDDNAYALALNGSSTVYVTGRSLNPGSFNDIVTLRYDQTAGGSLKVQSFNGTANDNDGGVALTGGSRAHVIGPAANAGVGLDYALLVYKSNFTPDQQMFFDGPGHLDDIPAAIVSSGG